MNGVFIVIALLQGLLFEISGSYIKSHEPKSRSGSIILACGYSVIILTLIYIIIMAIFNMAK